MGTMPIDLLDWEATQFELDLDEAIVRIHEAAITSLHAVHYDAEGASQEQVHEAEAAGAGSADRPALRDPRLFPSRHRHRVAFYRGVETPAPFSFRPIFLSRRAPAQAAGEID